MRTLLCLSQLLRQHLRQSPDDRPARSRGQVIVIFAVSLVALLLFVGLALDAGVVYVSYGQLKRAVDSAAVSAATNFKRNKTLDEMEASVLETLVLHNVNPDPALLQLEVRVCDSDSDGVRDAALATEEPAFYATCPDTTRDSPRKLIWVEAHQRTPLYFLSLLGFKHVNLETHATAEAAAVDLVLVIDISESMVQECETYIAGICVAWKSHGFSSSVAADYDPLDPTNGCATFNDCHPLQEAKDAAVDLVGSLYEGYDRVSVITFDSKATVRVPLTAGDLTATNKPAVIANIAGITPHDDAPFARMWPLWQSDEDGDRRYNPTYPDDRDGDGADADPLLPCDYSANSWWDDGDPCDLDDKYDAFNWDMDPGEVFTDDDQDYAENWNTTRGEDGRFTLVSTCTGCGMRVAANELKQNGRPGAVWVIIFLSDGAANMSDTPITGGTDPNTGDPIIPLVYPNGFCTQQYWGSNCFDTQLTPRYCIDEDADTCPPNTVWESRGLTSHYSVYDYALDMIDEAALTINRAYSVDPTYNPDEPVGNDIAIYSIGLGDAISYGEPLLRYMAAVGDDGDRNTDPCKTTPARKSCGNYYYAATGDALLPVFENIASRIYTRITQ